MPLGTGNPGAALSEIFFSYASADRERVRPFHDALTAHGFDVFWDAQVPTAADWDRMIKGKLEQSRCAIVFWSANSAASPNVRHEVDIARGDRKLVQVLLEPMSTKALPMGSIAEQAANLAGWRGDAAHAEWLKLLRAVEDLAAPRWMKRKLDALGLTLKAEQRRVLEADDKVRALTAAHDQEIVAQGDLRRERDGLRHEIEELRRPFRSAMEQQAVAASGVLNVVPDGGAAKVPEARAATLDRAATDADDREVERRVKIIMAEMTSRMMLNIGGALLLAALSYGPYAALKYLLNEGSFDLGLTLSLAVWEPGVANFCYVALAGSAILVMRHAILVVKKISFFRSASVLIYLFLFVYAAPLTSFFLIRLMSWWGYSSLFYAAIGIAFIVQMGVAIAMLIEGRKKSAET